MPKPADPVHVVLHAGQIVLADWRGDALPEEPNKRRPAFVVQDDGLFAPAYPNAILVPLADDEALAIPDLAAAIAPTSKMRLEPTRSRITRQQLAAIRRQIALAVGVEG